MGGGEAENKTCLLEVWLLRARVETLKDLQHRAAAAAAAGQHRSLTLLTCLITELGTFYQVNNLLFLFHLKSPLPVKLTS